MHGDACMSRYFSLHSKEKYEVELYSVQTKSLGGGGGG